MEETTKKKLNKANLPFIIFIGVLLLTIDLSFVAGILHQDIIIVA